MDTKVLLGQNSIMKCKVSSDPTVVYQIDWFHNNKYAENLICLLVLLVLLLYVILQKSWCRKF